MAIKYEFKYMPLVGKLAGKSMVEQTEQAINEIAKIVNDNVAQAEIINTLAEEANANSVEALEKATEALETSSRVYLNVSTAVNLDDYCESQLLYIGNVSSTNLPVLSKGFLEVKTDDEKTEAAQVFVADNKDFYIRTGSITETTVGDVTTYTATYGAWVKLSTSADLANYLPLAGGTMSGDIEYSNSGFDIKSTDINNDGTISIIGATSVLNGSSLTLYGANNAKSGNFQLSANDGIYTKTLEGGADGTLTWDGKNIARDVKTGTTNGTINVNGSDISIYGLGSNAFDSTSYLPLAGGTMTGTIRCDGANSTDFGISFANNATNVDVGWNYANRNGALLALHSTEHTTRPGGFDLIARDASNNAGLNGQPDGTLTWGGNNVLTAGNYNSYALPLSGGTLTGNITTSGNLTFSSTNASIYSTATNNAGKVTITGGASGNGAYVQVHGSASTGGAGFFNIVASDGIDSKQLQGRPNGTLTWDGQPIQTSSDKRLKQDFSTIPNDVLEAWGKVEWQQYKYKADVERKGAENCRFHVGLVAQDVQQVGEENDVDLLKYGILCHDEWEKDDTHEEAGDMWTVRYTEALCMEVAYLRRRAGRLEERIVRLENLVNAMENNNQEDTESIALL